MEKRPWEAVGLVRGPGHHDRFLFTDNLTGWFEGFTHADSLGRGYMVRDDFVFRGWTSSIDGVPLSRTSAALRDTVFPWGHRVDYSPEIREELLLHSGNRILSLRVNGPPGSEFSITPVLMAPLPPGLSCETVEVRTATSLTVHLVFFECTEERAGSLGKLTVPDPWETEVEARWDGLTRSWLITDDEEYNLGLFWAAASARSFVTKEFGAGLWGGFPWFKDNWGRDTFIALPGTLFCAGDFSTARAVIENFARYQNTDTADRNCGRIPNRVNKKEILYNTVDGTPWLIREIDEYIRYTGDRAFVRGLRPVIRRYVDGALKNYVDHDGLLRHDDADTWMDARIDGNQPWSPRGDRAVEIQALWIEALEVGQRLAEEDDDGTESEYYGRLALQARGAFDRRFVVQGTLVDRVSSRGAVDRTLRPNALMLAWINLVLPVDEAVVEATTRRLAEALLTPWGILSLDPDHPGFHPRHEDPGHWHKDAAYHNGSSWGWNAGFTVTALNRFGWQDRAWELTKNLTNQILNLGCMGTLSELVDALPGPRGAPVPSGTFSQAWSVAEFVRNAYQDYLGFHPDLPRGELRFRPALPSRWKEVRARLPYGNSGEVLTVQILQQATDDGGLRQAWTFEGPVSLPLLVLEIPTGQGRRTRTVLEPTGTKTKVTIDLPAPRTDAPPFTIPEVPQGGWPVDRDKDVWRDRLLGKV